MGALVGLGFIPERDFLDGGLVGELCPQALLPQSALPRAYKVIPFPKVSFKVLSLSLTLRVCGILSNHPLVNNKLSLLAANSIPLNQLSSREQQQQEEEQLVVGLDLSCQAAKHGAHSVAH
jgi:hypothetical protein